MKAKFRVTLILDVDYESDVTTFLNSLDDMRYAIDKIEDLSIKNKDWNGFDVQDLRNNAEYKDDAGVKKE